MKVKVKVRVRVSLMSLSLGSSGSSMTISSGCDLVLHAQVARLQHRLQNGELAVRVGARVRGRGRVR